jgi:hypothetical protein
MTRYITIAVLAVLVVYGLIEAWPLIAGPSVSLESPADNATVDQGIVTVAGTVARAALLTLNGAPLLQVIPIHIS